MESTFYPHSHPNKEFTMLILTRRPGEKIVIADREITIEILQARNGQVRIGIDAPKGVRVDREEIYVRRQAEALAKPM